MRRRQFAAREPAAGVFLARFCLVAALVATVVGCSSGGGDDGPAGGPITASFTASGTEQSPDLVRLTGSATADLVTLDVVIAGQTTSDELYAFAFDLVLSDGGVAGYVGGSWELGTALTLAPGQDGVALISQAGDRITVGVSKLGTGGGNGIGPTEETIVSLTLQVTERSATTIAIDVTPPEEPAALDPDENTIPSVRFDGASAWIRGS